MCETIKQNKNMEENKDIEGNKTTEENKEVKKGIWGRIKQSGFYRSLNTFASSAIIGLGITLIIFVYKVYSGKKQFEETADRLDNISRSLSTRCLGKFPAYISEINEIFATLETGDTVVVFEDVLYYGIKSDPLGFCRLQQLLLNHARQGGVVTVAYYDNHSKASAVPWASVFHRMVLESRIAQRYLSEINVERQKRIDQMVEKAPQGTFDKEGRQKMFAYIDSCVTEEFFAKTRDNDLEAAQKLVKGYLSFKDALVEESATNLLSDLLVSRLCNNIDSIMHHYLEYGPNSAKKSVKDIHFSDYENMYIDITDCIVEIYRYHGIELIPLNEYLTMSCWLIKPVNNKHSVKSILAFPSKYSSDEIGFYSQDELFSEYITTILQGVRGELNEEKERPSNF